MTDHEIEQRLRAWYRVDIADVDAAPSALRTRVAAIPADEARSRVRGNRRTLTLLAAAAVLVTGGAIAAGTGILRLPALQRSVFSGPLPEAFLASETVGWVSTGSTIYRTRDMGERWTTVQPPGWSTTAATAMVDPDTMYAADAGSPATIVATHDGGATWVRATIDIGSSSGGPVLSFRTPMAGFATFVGPNGTNSLRVFETKDGGRTWSGPTTGMVPHLTGTMDRLDPLPGGFMTQSVGMDDGTHGRDRLFLSVDGGSTWLDRTFPTSAFAATDERKDPIGLWADGSGRMVLAIATDQRLSVVPRWRAPTTAPSTSIYDSTDDGLSWRLVDGFQREFDTVQFLSATTWILAADDGSEFVSTIDAGRHWRSTQGPTGVPLYRVSFASPDRGWARHACYLPTDTLCAGSSDATVFVATTDGGRTWSRLVGP